MAAFHDAFMRTMQFEGGYSNDPADPGGATYKGISRRYHPDWRGWTIIDALPTSVRFDDYHPLQTAVEEFYRNTYWNPLGLEVYAQPVAATVFDHAVNTGGPRDGGRLLQNALNLLNRNGTRYPDLVVDGILGEKSVAAYTAITPQDLDILLEVLRVLRGMHYVELMRKDPRRERWVGWFRRLA